MKEKQIAMRIPEKHHVSLKKIAETEDTTISRIVRALIREYLEGRDD